MVTDRLTEFIIPIVSQIFGESAGQYVLNNSLTVVASLLVPIIAGVIIWVFFDFLNDVWKVPFAVAAELIAIFLFVMFPIALYPFALIVAGVIFLLTKEQIALRWIYVGGSFAKIILISPIGLLFLPAHVVGSIVLLPIITILLILACVTD